MGFNAGGTNVGGVQSLEHGNFKLMQETLAFSGTGTKDILITVPAGKKWIIKGFTMDSTGISTITQYQLILQDIGPAVQLKYYSSSSSLGVVIQIANQLTIPAGHSLLFSYSVGADTSGIGRARLAYVESDA